MNRQMKYLLTLFVFLYSGLFAQTPTSFNAIPLNNLSAFANPGNNWILASDAVAGLDKPGELKPVDGVGVLVNNITKKSRSHLITNEQFGDVELEIEFMMAKGANSGIYLQGRYELQLMDSWAKAEPGFSDCGGIYQRWDKQKDSGFEGYAPLVNVARAPGLWQQLKIQFRAPRFNSEGIKTENARFETVYLNGVLVQQQIALTGVTRGSLFEDERTTGPLMIQGDHGNVAFRNIRYRALTGDNSTPEKVRLVNPILVQPANKPYLLRSFLSYGNKLLTHTISVGDPSQLNYSYDLKRGALLQIWRGKFADATDLWHERGEPYQRIVPLGSVITLSDAPVLAVLPNSSITSWPDSIGFDAVETKGYTLNASGMPAYRYIINGVSVNDQIVLAGNEGLQRTLTVANPAANLYHRIAAAKSIIRIKKGVYAVDDKSFYLMIDEKQAPFIRQSGSMQELLVPVTQPGAVITYSFIW